MKDKLAKGVAWLGAAKIIINILALLSTLLLARLLSPEDFGLVALATTMLTIISSLTDLSLNSALIHHDNPTAEHFQTAWTLNLIRAVIVGSIFCVAAPIAATAYEEPRLLNIMLVLALSVAMGGLSNPKTVVFTRDLIFWQEFAITVLQKLAGFTVGAAIAIIYKSYWALVGGMIAAQVVGIIVSYVVIPFKPRFVFVYARQLWSFSIWLTLGQIVNTLNWKLDHLLIGGYLGRPALGFYSVGDNLAGMPTREIIGPLETTLFPGFAKMANDKSRLKIAYRSAQSLISSIALPAGIGCALIAHPLVLLGMGAKWLPAVGVIQVLACVFAIQTLSSPVHSLAMAKGETRLLFKRDLLSFCIRVPIILVGMYLGGLMGIIYARAVTGMIAMLINMVLVRQMIGLGLVGQFSSNKRSIISVLVMTAGVLWVENLMGRDGVSIFLGLKIMTFGLTGFLLYTLTHASLWILEKKPDGPETEIRRILSKIAGKLKSGAR
jgi:lipopolysaccharide exporter